MEHRLLPTDLPFILVELVRRESRGNPGALVNLFWDETCVDGFP